MGSEMCIRDRDDAGFLLMRCVHSPGTTRVLLANIIFHSKPKKTNPIQKHSEDTGTLVPFLKLFLEVDYFLGPREQKMTKPNQNVNFANTGQRAVFLCPLFCRRAFLFLIFFLWAFFFNTSSATARVVDWLCPAQ